MSNRTPYLLLAFANPVQSPEKYLIFLEKESTLVYEHLENLALEDRCDVNRLPNATVEQIFNMIEKWDRRKDLILFHYGGHASNNQLLLTTEDAKGKAANANGFAELLGGIPSLKLVFLNGCSTKGQVSLLLKKGVKAVIATSSPIQDEMAVDFASRFYQNLAAGESIGDSFESARTFVKTKFTHEVLTVRESRDLLVLNPNQAGDELPWGLYHHPKDKAILDWTLPEKGSNPASRATEITEKELAEELRKSRRSNRWMIPIGFLLGLILLGSLLFVNQIEFVTPKYDLEIRFYEDNKLSKVIEEGKVEVWYENSPDIEYEIKSGRITVKDFEANSKGDTIKIKLDIDGITNEVISTVVPIEGTILEISLAKFKATTKVSGTIYKKTGGYLQQTMVIIGSDTTYTNKYGDFNLTIPYPEGKRVRVRVIHNGNEVYNGEEIVSSTPINFQFD